MFQLVKRDFQQRYVGSAAGWVWSVIHPLVLWASYVFIFKVLGNSPTPNYPLVLFAGMVPWFLFSETVTRSSTAMVEHANLITKTMFPSEILPVAIFLSSLASSILVTVLVAIVSVFVVGHFNPGIALIVYYAPLIGLLAVGFGWIAGALQVYLRDTAQLVTVMMTFWFWLTPIFIPEESLPAKAQWVRPLFLANPMTYFVRAYREMLLGTSAPPLRDAAIAAAFAIGIFVLGGLFFRQMKKGFADVL